MILYCLGEDQPMAVGYGERTYLVKNKETGRKILLDNAG